MRILFFYLFGLVAVACAGQTQRKQIDAIERRTLSKKDWIVRFEKADTIDESGRRFQVSRSYYFDKDRKNLLLITSNEKLFWPYRGHRVWYTFSDNRLVKVTVSPSKKVCRRCSAQYYFFNDSLTYANEKRYSARDVCFFVADSKRLSFKVLRTAQGRLP